MVLTTEFIDEFRAQLAAEQEYYRDLQARIRLAQFTGSPIPPVLPYSGPRMWDHAGSVPPPPPPPPPPSPPHEASISASPPPSPRLPLAPGWAATFLAPRVEGRAPVFAWSRAREPRRRPAGRLRSLATAFARAMWPVRRRGPVL
jgi:hypothetical protein